MFLLLSPAHAGRTSTRCPAQSVVLLTLLSLVLAPTAHAAEAPLTLARAQDIALSRSRQLIAQDHAVAASRDMAVAASQLPDPILKAGVDNVPIRGDDRFSLSRDFMTMRRVGVMQELTRTEKRNLRAGRFEREAEKTLAEQELARAAIERDTALAWLDRYYAETVAKAIAEQGAQARNELDAAEGAYRGGRGTQADLLVARAAVAMFDDRASESERRVQNATTMLGRWVGDAAGSPLDGKPDIDTLRIEPGQLEPQLERHPEISVQKKQEEIAQADARLAQAERRADWSLEVAYQQRGDAYSDMVSVGVSVPLQWDRKKRQDRVLSARLAAVEQAKAERDERLRAYVAETRSAIQEWENNRARLARYRSALIPLAQARTSATVTAYGGGKASLPDVLAARRNETEVRIQALQLESDTARRWAQINFLAPRASGPERSKQQEPR
ncbi:TolC family protein [Massilia cavernae]|uniref:TolC family protein n=1 Tax=Massilia cavernae TaxID=2320864 RepID=A0A418Y714_9BURK|nr:TolC family protein [Massilia cavernae]RJG24682.1 TolC family protein [Massilia cavernae]